MEELEMKPCLSDFNGTTSREPVTVRAGEVQARGRAALAYDKNYNY